jgi:hypothetical protein
LLQKRFAAEPERIKLTDMKKTEKATYEKPSFRVVSYVLADVILGSGGPGDDIPYDPGDDDTL